MDRRSFLKAGTAGLGVGLTLTSAQAVAGENGKKWGQRPKLPDAVDHEAFAARVIEEFTTNKRSCSESMVIVGCEVMKVDSVLLPEMMYGLAGGIGRCGYACGLVTGGAVVLSMAISAVETERATAWPMAMASVESYVTAFEQMPSVLAAADQPTANCYTISKVNLRDPEERKNMNGPTGVKMMVCKPIAKEAAMLLAGCLQVIIDTYR